MLNTNMKILFVTNKYFSRYNHFFFVALKSPSTTSFEIVEKHFIVKAKMIEVDRYLTFTDISRSRLLDLDLGSTNCLDYV